MIYIVIIIIIHSAHFVNQNRVVLWSHFTTKEKGGDSPPFLYVLELTAHIHIAAAAIVVIVWHKAVAAVVIAAVDPDNHDGDDNDNPECFVIIAENAIVVAADIVARIIAAAVIITIHHSKYLRLKIKFTLHTIRNTDFCY